mmetsp:Transcript_6318/g.10960  ORF Transcript_6318/g.10960 Transcript_6318/m.10960 type:complete len:545 (-) Transcript_6318:1743-3377(-)
MMDRSLSHSLLKQSFSQVKTERQERMVADLHKAMTERATAEFTRQKFQYSEPRLGNPKPADYFIEKARKSSEERHQKRLEASRSSLKLRPSASNFSLGVRSKSVARAFEQSKSSNDISSETVHKYTSDESINKCFPRWLLKDSEFVSRVKEMGYSSQMKIAEACRKPTKFRTNIEKEGLLSYISEIEYFRAMPAGVIKKACDKMMTVEFKLGEYLIKQGEEGDCMYVLLSGSVAVTLFGVKIVEIFENNVIGETALQSQSRRTATVIASSNAVCLKLRKSDYESVLFILKKEERNALTRELMTYPTFSDWSREKVHLLTNYLISKIYKRDQVIYEQGQRSNVFYVLKTGKVLLQTYVKVQMGNKWPIGSRLWEEVRLEKTVTIDIREVHPGETFGGHEIVDGSERTTRAFAKENSTVLSINETDLASQFLRSDIEQLLQLSKFVLPTSDELQAMAKAKLSKLKDHKKAIADSIAADFNYSERTNADSLRLSMMRKWIGGFNRKSKLENHNLMQDIVDVSKSVKYITKRREVKKKALRPSALVVL